LYTVDRIEGNFAVIEDGENRFNRPLEQLPENIKEGDVLDSNFNIRNDNSAELKRKIKEREQALLNRKKK
jgi:hypothetical protein